MSSGFYYRVLDFKAKISCKVSLFKDLLSPCLPDGGFNRRFFNKTKDSLQTDKEVESSIPPLHEGSINESAR